MKEILAAAIGIWLVFVLVFASLVGADTGEAPAPAPKAGPIARTEVSKSVVPAGRTVLLDNGTWLVIPGSVNLNPPR